MAHPKPWTAHFVKGYVFENFLFQGFQWYPIGPPASPATSGSNPSHLGHMSCLVPNTTASRRAIGRGFKSLQCFLTIQSSLTIQLTNRLIHLGRSWQMYLNVEKTALGKNCFRSHHLLFFKNREFSVKTWHPSFPEMFGRIRLWCQMWLTTTPPPERDHLKRKCRFINFPAICQF